MKKQMELEAIQWVVSEMAALTKEHPKAKIVFDLERGEVLVTYPLPRGFIPHYKKSEYPC